MSEAGPSLSITEARQELLDAIDLLEAHIDELEKDREEVDIALNSLRHRITVYQTAVRYLSLNLV